jgi:hypothetical protein
MLAIGGKDKEIKIYFSECQMSTCSEMFKMNVFIDRLERRQHEILTSRGQCRSTSAACEKHNQVLASKQGIYWLANLFMILWADNLF